MNLVEIDLPIGRMPYGKNHGTPAGAHCHVAGVKYTVHRLMLELMDGILRIGQMACHSCNNRRCVNPKHLVRGSAMNNRLDYLESVQAGRKSKRRVVEHETSDIRQSVVDAYGKGTK